MAKRREIPPPTGSSEPNWPYMMKVLYEIWFREHGYNVKCYFEPVPDGESQKEE